ncbi:roundabout homolog 1-like isoform X2 [Artemia franciscana]
MNSSILDNNKHYFQGHLGENISLNCQDEDNFNVNDDRFWRRQLLNGTLENLFFGTQKITTDPRFRISRDGNLTIEDLSPGYFGIYVCSPPSHSPFSRGSIVHAVKGYIPPKVSAVKSMIVAPEDDQVTLKCMATGYPQPDIIWKRNDKGKEMFDGQIIAERFWISSNINIPSVLKDTIPSYRCVAEGDYDEAHWKDFSYKEILFAKPAEDQKEDQSPFPWKTGVHPFYSNVSFSCQVEDIGDDVRLWRRELPDGNIQDLFFGGEKITADSRFEISRDGNLTITDVIPHYSGKYICSVPTRSRTVVHSLYAEDYLEGKIVAEDGSVTLNCRVAGVPLPLNYSQTEIIWFKRSWPLDDVQHKDIKENIFDNGETFTPTVTISTITISKNNAGAYGSYECMATNFAGSDKAEISVEAQNPYNFNISLSVTRIAEMSADLNWTGVPYPEDKYVTLYRVLFQGDGDPDTAAAFKLAKYDAPSFMTVKELKPCHKYRFWIEAYLTNGKVKISNVIDVMTKPGQIPKNSLPGSCLIQSSQDKGGDRSDQKYFIAMTIMAVVAGCAVLLVIILSIILLRWGTKATATITARKSQSAYANPSYKNYESGEANDHGNKNLNDML